MHTELSSMILIMTCKNILDWPRFRNFLKGKAGNWWWEYLWPVLLTRDKRNWTTSSRSRLASLMAHTVLAPAGRWLEQTVLRLRLLIQKCLQELEKTSSYRERRRKRRSSLLKRVEAVLITESSQKKLWEGFSLWFQWFEPRWLTTGTCTWWEWVCVKIQQVFLNWTAC